MSRVMMSKNKDNLNLLFKAGWLFMGCQNITFLTELLKFCCKTTFPPFRALILEKGSSFPPDLIQRSWE